VDEGKKRRMASGLIVAGSFSTGFPGSRRELISIITLEKVISPLGFDPAACTVESSGINKDSDYVV
jgi:hypothetical protein